MKPLAKKAFGESGQKDSTFIRYFGVSPEFQGRGIGSALLKAICEDVDKSGGEMTLQTGAEANVSHYSSYRSSRYWLKRSDFNR